MPPIGGFGKPKRKPQIKAPERRSYTLTPDQADRLRPPAQQKRDRAAVRRSIALSIARSQARARVTPDQADRSRTPAQKAHDAQIVARNVREARARYLAKRGSGSITRAVGHELKAEVQGKGLIGKLAGAVVKGIDKAPLWPSSRHIAVVNGRPQQAGIGGQDYAQRAVKDAVNAAAQVIPSAAMSTAATYELAHGRPQRAKKLLKDFTDNDAVYNAAAAGVELTRGNQKAAHSHWKKAKKSADEHPGFLALELYGGKGVVGRGAGGLVRTTARATGSERLKKVGSTQRTPATVPGTNIVEHRRYSKDLFRKGTQIYQDRVRAKEADQLRDQARHEPDPQKRVKLMARARKVDPLLIRDRGIGRRVDEHAAMSETVRRINQGRLLKVETRETKRAAKGGPVVSLLAQRIVRPTVKSLQDYRSDLVAVQPNLKGAKLTANKQLVHDLDAAIEQVRTGKLSIDEMHEIAKRYTTRNIVQQERLASHDIYADEQSQRRAVLPGAIREMGVHRDPTLLKEREKAAKKTSQKATRTAAKARGRTLRKRAVHKQATTAAARELKTANIRDVSVLRAMEKAALAEKAAREKGIASSGKRAKTKTGQAAVARDQANAATKLRKSNPFLIAEDVTRDVTVKPRSKKTKPTTKKVTTREKRKVTTKEMLEALGGRPAVVSQRPPQRSGGGDFFRSGLAPAKGEKAGLSGRATQEGTFDASADALLRQQTKSEALGTQAENYADFVDEFARHYLPEDAELIGRPSPKDKPGELITRADRKEAEQVADDLSSKGDIDWTVAPRGVRTGDEGPWVIVPAEAAKRMRGHQDVLAATPAERAIRSFSSGFQRTVLAPSLPWMVGNASEATFRGAVNRVGPGSYVRGRQYLKAIRKLDPDQARRVEARTLGGGQAAFLDRQIHANLDSYTDGLVRDMTAAGKVVRNLPVAKQAMWFWDRYTHHVFNTVNKSIEQAFQTGMLGKAVKDKLMTEDLQRANKAAIEEFAAKGGLSRNTAIDLGREIDKMYGRYEKFSPSGKAMLARYTPFGAWIRNAAEFLSTAPERHPASTVGATALVGATEEDRKQLGMDIDPAKPGDLADFLQGSFPGRFPGSEGQGHYRLTRFTPMSLLTDPLGTVSSAVMPQFRSVLYALNGLDWTGKPLKGKNGADASWEDEAAAAAKAFADASVPFLSLGKRIAKRGAIAIPQSAVGYSPPGKPAGGGGGGRSTGSRLDSSRLGGSSRLSSSRLSSSSRLK